ncbi:MAG: biotin--[acetyl-CoA-carboxylase] ligase [candidate division WOR-3 bacterium]
MTREILKFKQVSSTQDVLRKFASKRRELAVFAYKQTQGRGRQKRNWFSPSGGLYLSILTFPEKHTNTIPLIAALAVIDSLKDLQFANLSIHWPNDIMLHNKKVCGILCETYCDTVICGIGLNVNIRKFPANLANATSLFLESGKVYKLEPLLKEILENFWRYYEKLQNDELKISEISHYISGIGEPVEVKLSSKKTIKGVVHNVDVDWALLVRTEDGFIRKIYYGDVIRLT